MSGKQQIRKSPTGIVGLDEITGGGLPTGRPTLICGGAGCGKTLMSMEFLVRGATQFNEPGAYFAFEESAKELTENVRALGFDLDRLQRKKLLHVEYVHIDPAEVVEAGEFDLEGLFIRLASAVDRVGARRVALDTIESLFGGFTNQALLRAELRRLFRWLKDRELTAVITGERGEGSLTRQGLEEYVSDCVILLDHRVIDQISTRRLRIIKYRGTTHGTNEYPFLIDQDGIDVLPITSLRLDHGVSTQRVSTGVDELDSMLEGGVYRGTTVLISGTAGTGKSSMAAHFARAACDEGERCLFLAFEESPGQIKRNMRSIGIDLGAFENNGLLQFVAARPVLYGLESHLATIHKLVRTFKPRILIMDPISDLSAVGTERDAKSMMTRLIDYLKSQQITAVLTNLNQGGSVREQTDMGVSSIIDTWLLLRDIESGGERNRALYILKSRGTAHSNQIREFLLTSDGIRLLPAYIGPEGVLTGSARLTQETRERAELISRRQEAMRQQRALEGKRKALEAQMAALRSEFELVSHEAEVISARERERQEQHERDRRAMAESRKAGSIEFNRSAPQRNGRKRRRSRREQ